MSHLSFIVLQVKCLFQGCGLLHISVTYQMWINTQKQHHCLAPDYDAKCLKLHIWVDLFGEYFYWESETGQCSMWRVDQWPLLKRSEVQAVGPLPEGHFLCIIAVSLTRHQGEGRRWGPHHTTFPKPAVPGQQNRLHHELKLDQRKERQKHDVPLKPEWDWKRKTGSYTTMLMLRHLT